MTSEAEKDGELTPEEKEDLRKEDEFFARKQAIRQDEVLQMQEIKNRSKSRKE